MKAPATVSTGLKGAQSVVANVLRSPWFWLVVGTLLFFFLRAKLPQWWKALTAEDRGNYQGHQGMNAADIARVEQIAQSMRSAINGIGSVSGEAAQANGMNDTELKYLADFYEDINDGTSLWQDLDDEWFTGDEVDRLMSRLAQIAAT